jgi:hypothetical protein
MGDLLVAEAANVFRLCCREIYPALGGEVNERRPRFRRGFAQLRYPAPLDGDLNP